MRIPVVDLRPNHSWIVNVRRPSAERRRPRTTSTLPDEFRILTRQALGHRLRTARQLGGLTVREVAAEAGIDPSYYSRMERGRAPLGRHCQPLARIYGMDAAELARLAARCPRPPR